ncbi:MAG: glycosyltransferase family 2 protein [Thermodesulfobacteriota bacterium]|nr:MAG: glycosyltransferase family 2 protein [Thermodesulfobacteriota bacterium]
MTERLRQRTLPAPMVPDKKILVIIPAFNEEASIGGVISLVRKHAPGADIVVVNDGSSDRTGAVAEGLGVTVLNHIYNLGIGATMQTGYKYALRRGYDIAVQVDGDGQHPADQIIDLVRPVAEGKAEMVVGSRFLGMGEYRPSIARSAGMVFFSRLVSAIIRERMTDTTSGFRAAGRSCIEFFSSRYPDDYPEVEALVLLHKKGFRVMEVPVEMAKRAGGRSSITPMKSVYYMAKVLLAILVDLIKRA